MRKDNKALYEQIMRNISREVKRVLNEQDYYANNNTYTVTSTDDTVNDTVSKKALLTQVEPTNKDEIRLKQWIDSGEFNRMNRVVTNAIYGIRDINKLIRRWAMAIMLNVTQYRFFNDLEKLIIAKTGITSNELNSAKKYWEREGQRRYPEYWNKK